MVYMNLQQQLNDLKDRISMNEMMRPLYKKTGVLMAIAHLSRERASCFPWEILKKRTIKKRIDELNNDLSA